MGINPAKGNSCNSWYHIDVLTVLFEEKEGFLIMFNAL